MNKILRVLHLEDDASDAKLVEAVREQLVSIVDNSDDAIIGKTLEGIIVNWNRGAERLYGYSAEEIVGRSVEVLVPPDRPAELSGILESIAKGKSVHNYETSRCRKDGQLVDVSLTVSPIWNAAGKVIGASTISRDLSEQKRTEETLRLQAALFDQAYDATLVWQLHGPIIFWNRGAERLYGYPRQEALGSLAYDLLHTSTPGGMTAFLQTLERDGQWEGELEHSTRDGRRVIVESRIALVHDPEGVLVLEANRDITERKQVEQALSASETRYRRLFETAQDGVLLLDAETGAITDANPFLLKLLGYTEEELLGSKLWDIGAFPDILRSQDAFRGLQEAGFVRYEDLPLQAKSGDGREVEFVSNVYEAGGMKVIQCNIRDITERKRAQKALSVSETRYRRLFEMAQDGILLLDSETGAITDANPSLLKLLGYTEKEVLGSKLWDIGAFPDILRSQDAFRSLQDAGFVRYEDLPLQAKSGDRREVEFVSNVYEAGGMKVIQCNIRDITERKRAEEAIRELNASLERRVAARTVELSGANKELEAFSYSVSHDLRAPLRAMDGFCQALIEDHADKLDSEGKNYLERIRAASQRMDQLVDGILGLSRTGRTEMRQTTVDLSALAEAIALDLRQSDPGRSVEFVIAPGLVANGDTNLLRAVIENLLRNAWKFTSKHPQARIEMGAVRHEGETAYFVRDDGAGFDMTYASKLFGAFQRLHTPVEFEGTGIGLANVQRIIHRHGGRVWAEGDVEKGAVLYFTLGKTIERAVESQKLIVRS